MEYNIEFDLPDNETILKEIEAEPFEAIDLRTGTRKMVSEYCYVVGWFKWDSSEVAFDFQNCGPRWLRPPDVCGLPVRRQWYLVALESGAVLTLSYEFDEDRWQGVGTPVTHWMPLPEPPKEDKNVD